ncbi:MAG TPA: hypothetical protein VM074_06585 [Solimonas sp.]|nr:hypothetical protein [Solimonas sp.]
MEPIFTAAGPTPGERLLAWLEPLVYRWRGAVLLVLAAVSLVLALGAIALRFDPGLGRWLPEQHPYLQVLEQYREDFGGANTLLVAVLQRDTSHDIYNEAFLARLKRVTDAVRNLPGVERARVSSLVTPDVRYLQVSEGNAVGGSVVPAQFRPTPQFFEQVRANVARSGVIGRYTTRDQRGAMVYAQVAEQDLDSGRRLDYRELSRQLEARLRPFDDQRFAIHVVGHAQLAADLLRARGAALLWLAGSLAAILGLLALWLAHWKLALLPVASATAAVLWQLGLLGLSGGRLDPAGYMAPLCAFAAALALALQQAGVWADELAAGKNSYDASLAAFRRCAVPTGVGLLAAVAGAVTLAWVPLAAVGEMARDAAFGFLAALAANLLLLPLWLSFTTLGDTQRLVQRRAARAALLEPLLRHLDAAARPGVAASLVLLGAALAGWACWRAELLAFGQPATGAPELRSEARYNRDAAALAAAFAAGPQMLRVIAEADPESCVDHDVMEQIDRLDWHLRNVPGVREVVSLPDQARKAAAAFADGNPRFSTLPRNRYNLVQTITPIPASSGLLNANCSAMALLVFTADRGAATLGAVTRQVEQFDEANARAWFELHRGTSDSRTCHRKMAARDEAAASRLALHQRIAALHAREYAETEIDGDRGVVALRARAGEARHSLESMEQACPVRFALASGPLAVVAASNQLVQRQAFSALGWACLAALAAVWLASGSLALGLCALAPPLLVATLAYALMARLGIPLTPPLLALVPLLTLAGVAANALLQLRITGSLRGGMVPQAAAAQGARATAPALLAWGAALGLGLGLWGWADLKLQADLGVLLAFGCFANALAAVVLGPALAACLLDSPRD